MRSERRLSAELEPGPVRSAQAAEEGVIAITPPISRRAALGRRRLALHRVRLPVETDPVGQVRKRERVYRHSLAAADMLVAVVSSLVAIDWVGGDRLKWWSFLVIPPLVLLTSKVLGLYDHDELVVRKSTIDELPRLINLASSFTLLFWVTRHWTVSGAPNTQAIVSLWLALAVSIAGARTLARRFAAAVSPLERCLLLGDRRAFERLKGPLGAERGADLVGCVPLERAMYEEYALRGLAEADGVHRIIIAADETARPEEILELVRRAKLTGLRVSLFPGILEAVGSSVVCDEIGGVTLLGVPRFGLTRSSIALKRGFDVVGAGVLMLAAIPLMAVAAVLIRLDSGGPVLFRQTRVGRDGEHFPMIKLRTMVVGAEAMKAELMDLNETHGVFKIADDPRVTRVGRWLRRSNLDELPQLFNVLRGEMSLVGPRPLVIDEDERVVGMDRRRLHLQPGMTGPWQTLGKRVPLGEMVKVDYLYVANWSLWIDIKILLRTIPQVLAGRGR